MSSLHTFHTNVIRCVLRQIQRQRIQPTRVRQFSQLQVRRELLQDNRNHRSFRSKHTLIRRHLVTRFTTFKGTYPQLHMFHHSVTSSISRVFRIQVNLTGPFRRLISAIHGQFKVISVRISRNFRATIFGIYIVIFTYTTANLVTTTVRRYRVRLLTSHVIRNRHRVVTTIVLHITRGRLQKGRVLPSGLYANNRNRHFNYGSSYT